MFASLELRDNLTCAIYGGRIYKNANSCNILIYIIQLLTTYGQEYWIQKRQYMKLTKPQQQLAKKWCKSTARDIIGKSS